MNGKSKCKILKEIRREIARQNDIEFVTSECKFQGNCTGTCPKCESEVRYLEQELQKRRKAGKAVAVAGIAAAMLVSAAGCRSGNPETNRPASQTEETQESGEQELLGDIEIVDGQMETEPLLGKPGETTAGVPVEPLMGDVPPVPGEVPES